MELKEYISLLKGYLWLVIGTPVAFFLLGFFVTTNKPPTFEASTTLTVEKPQAAPTAAGTFYQYDQYYAQLASTLYADTISNMLKSPGPVVEVFEKAGLPAPAGSAQEVARTFRVSKGQETTVMSLTVQQQSEQDAVKVVDAAKDVIQTKVAELKAVNHDPSYFVVAASPTKVFEVKTNAVLTGLLGAVSGLVVAVILAFVLAALTSPRRP